MPAAPNQVQWFPLFQSEQAVFQLDGAPSGGAGSQARMTITLDTFPYMVYGLRFTTSYELPPDFWVANLDWKQFMRLGGVDDDYDVSIKLTQGNVTTQRDAHVRNLQGANDINKHPWPLPYPLRGGNKIEVTATRNSSYPIVIDPATEEETPLTILLKVSALTARGARNVLDGVTSPTPPPSTGFP